MLKISNAEYHARPEISKSQLDMIRDAPYKFKNAHLYRKEGAQFVMGSAFHTMVLEPELFNSEYVVAPSLELRTKAGKEAMAEFTASAGSRAILKADEYETLQKMTEAVNNNIYCKALLSGAIVEGSVISNLEGVPVRARFDAYNQKINCLIDLKSTVDSSPAAFAKSAANYRYHVQDAFYGDILANEGYAVDKFVFIVVSKTTHEVGIYDLDNTAREFGRDSYIKDLETYKWCKENNTWPLYEDFESGEVKPVRTITLPNYAYYQ